MSIVSIRAWHQTIYILVYVITTDTNSMNAGAVEVVSPQNKLNMINKITIHLMTGLSLFPLSSQLVLQALSNTNSNMFKIVGVVRPETPNGLCNHSQVCGVKPVFRIRIYIL